MRIVVFGHNDWWVWERQGFCTRNAALVRELAGRDEIAACSSSTRRAGARGRTARLSCVAKSSRRSQTRWPCATPTRCRCRRPGAPGRRVNERLSRRLCCAGSAWASRPASRSSSGSPIHGSWRRPCACRTTCSSSTPSTTGASIRGRAKAVAEGYRLAARHADVVFAVHPSPAGAAPARRTGRGALQRRRRRAVGRRRPRPRSSPDAPAAAGRLRRHDPAPRGRDAAGRTSPAGCREATLHAGRARLAGVPRELGDPGPNVWLLGSAPLRELPGLIAACDVCIVPHLRDELTASMDPLKLYEYAAAGKPVVSTVSSPNPALAAWRGRPTERTAFAAAVAGRRASRTTATRRTVRRAAVEPRRGRAGPTASCRCSARRFDGRRDPAVSVWAVIAHYGDAAATARAVERLLAGDAVPTAILVVDNKGTWRGRLPPGRLGGRRRDRHSGPQHRLRRGRRARYAASARRRRRLGMVREQRRASASATACRGSLAAGSGVRLAGLISAGDRLRRRRRPLVRRRRRATAAAWACATGRSRWPARPTTSGSRPAARCWRVPPSSRTAARWTRTCSCTTRTSTGACGARREGGASCSSRARSWSTTWRGGTAGASSPHRPSTT